MQVPATGLKNEVFSALFFNIQHRVIRFEGLSRYSVSRKQSLQRHRCDLGTQPSLGDAAPSDADRRITQRFKEALGLVEIRVIDHVVVGSKGCESFAELGYL
ncbi:JAB domain-containing protein [Chromohalobacter sp. HP20-39]|uniref:JAB domain-containing protein n=1 Tax=Chromohalobacter sp. HP20-39 TaxID=3079306 RepID=UPI00294AC6B5|nr:JAB domain-containing protein [Chromohalobacter sp. HP20-39]MDV6320139.1 JAB domain-containing protein [Chromohalobacter sp. HP20-39]